MQLIEINGRVESDRRRPIFDALRNGAIVVYRDLPEVHTLSETIRARMTQPANPISPNVLIDFFRTGQLADLQTFSAIYRAFRPLRDARYLSCLFSDLIEGLDLPRPVLVDSGYCRMIAPDLATEVSMRPELFAPDEFGPQHPNEVEHMVQPVHPGGNAHRDLDARHYHFQMNFWFPLHDLDETQTLLLFPDSYYRDVPQYEPISDRDRPSEWGFGEALQISLKFGDVIAFHSQMLHASPTQAPHRNRFTVEMRVASGCIDDNSRIYRRSFWGLRNFLPNGQLPTAAVRAQELAEPSLPQLDVNRAVSGSSAHAVVHHLFRTADASLKAGYLRRPDAILEEAFVLDSAQWSRVLKRLDQLPRDEDLLLLVARLLLWQGFELDGMALLRRICNKTASYFWALEVGYFAAANGEKGLAAFAFEKAARLAAGSSIKLDQYAHGLPPSRSSDLLQLLPATALQISDGLLHLLATDGVADASKFDHRLHWSNVSAATRPIPSRAFGAANRPSTAAPSGDLIPRLIKSHHGYNIVQCGADLIAVDQKLGPIRLFEETIGEREIGSIVIKSQNLDELVSKIDAIVASTRS
jgi:hypothetical protein